MVIRRSLIEESGEAFVKGLESSVAYRAFCFHPATGKQNEPVDVMQDASDAWQPSITPTFADWIMVLEKKI